MPTIQRIEKKPKSTYHSNTEMRELRRKAYSTTLWRKTRALYIREHPICEECLKEGRVYAGGDEKYGELQVHHREGFIRNGEVDHALFTDPNNLETICSYHHGLEHQQEKGYVNPQDVITQLEELFGE